MPNWHYPKNIPANGVRDAGELENDDPYNDNQLYLIIHFAGRLAPQAIPGEMHDGPKIAGELHWPVRSRYPDQQAFRDHPIPHHLEQVVEIAQHKAPQMLPDRYEQARLGV
jgi:hypothetical protein